MWLLFILVINAGTGTVVIPNMGDAPAIRNSEAECMVSGAVLTAKLEAQFDNVAARFICINAATLGGGS